MSRTPSEQPTVTVRDIADPEKFEADIKFASWGEFYFPLFAAEHLHALDKDFEVPAITRFKVCPFKYFKMQCMTEIKGPK